MHDNHLEVLHSVIKEKVFPDFTATKFRIINENGVTSESGVSHVKEGYYDYRLFLEGNPLACNFCVKRENSDLKLFEEDRQYSIKEDWLFLLENLRDSRIYIADKVTITLYDHPLRSMRSDNSIIIKKTKLAEKWILNKLSLSTAEIKTLRAHVNYFCGIHSYLDDHRKDAVKFAFDAIKSGGVKLKYLSLLLKSVAGKKVISKIK